MQKLNVITLKGLITVLVSLDTQEMDTSAQVTSFGLYLFYVASKPAESLGLASSFDCMQL